jgi:D-glycero-alpha-D-manno-heptose 1-phosphate guanylyltransferase
MKAIILAGGFGTRLKEISKDTPKPMMDINGRPFLEYLFDYLISSGIAEVILSLHHQPEKFIEHFGENYKNLKISYAIEKEPLGTGGAILNAMKNADEGNYFVLNGDCFQEINYHNLYQKFSNKNITITLREIDNTTRFGRVEVDAQKITSFKEKGIGGKGLINAGCYLINSKWFKSLNLPEKFSFENDFLIKYLQRINFNYYIAEGYFIDIGVPEDYFRFCRRY